MFSYRSIIKKALKTSWRYKYLWFFGLFATLINPGGEYQILNKIIKDGFSGNFGSDWKMLASTGIFSLQAMSNMLGLMKANPISALMTVIAIVLLLCLIAFVLWLAISSQGAIVSKTQKIEEGKNQDKPDFRADLNQGAKAFWPILGFNAFLKIGINIAFFLVSLPVILMVTNSIAFSIIYVILFLLFIPVAISLSLIAKYAIGFSVIKKKGFFDSLKKSWKLFHENWVISLEMAIALFSLNILASFAILLVILIFPMPLFFVCLALGKVTIALIVVLLAILFMIVSGSFLTTFQISAWTDLFLRLNNGSAVSKLDRLFTKKHKK
ncbi:MAG: hypothetical protein NT165_01890 [Candidatus Falkowbacteria bacterium]|nr:hypothetical protein [Candidatus Falkowbacteria bacterium]